MNIFQPSEFHLLSDNANAFVARAALIQTAQRRLDIQYYSIHNDASGNHLMHMVLAAADRGVEVRILVDDMNLSGRDRDLKLFSLHPNIKIRIFNPLTNREWFRNLELVIYQGRADRRMHNKAIIADREIAIIGGRNLGDAYFDNRNHINFVDLDLLSQGPVVQDISRSFKNYWKSSWAIPIAKLSMLSVAKKQLASVKKRLKDRWYRFRNTAYFQSIHLSQFSEQLQQHTLPFIQAPAQLFHDLPEKVSQPEIDADDQLILNLRPLIDDAKSEVIIASPYFIPGDDGVQWLKQRVADGISVTVLTNSLSTTDVMAVHAGYQRYRTAVLAAGIRLYELKSTVHARFAHARRVLQGESKISLHAKYLIVDRRWVYTGSANLDPRSRRLNTEIGVMIDSPQLATEILELFRQTTQPKNCYRLSTEEQGLCWNTTEHGHQVQYSHEPKAGIWKRMLVRLIALLPAENLL